VAAIIDPRPVIGLALSPDGRQLVSSGFDGILKVWDVERGMQMHAFRAFVDPAWGWRFSADGRSFAAGGPQPGPKIWDTSDWAEKELLRGHAARAFALPSHRTAAGSSAGRGTIWPWSGRPARITGRKKCPQLLRGPQWVDRTPGIAFSPDSRLFAGTAADARSRSGARTPSKTVASFPDEARTVAFSADGKSVLNEGYTGIVRRWILGGHEPGQTLNPKASFTNWQVDSLTPGTGHLCGRPARNPGQCQLCESPGPRRHQWRGDAYHAHDRHVIRWKDHVCRLAAGSVEAWDVATRQRRFHYSRAPSLMSPRSPVSADGRYLGHRQPGQFNQALGRRHWPISRDFP